MVDTLWEKIPANNHLYIYMSAHIMSGQYYLL